MSSLSADMTFQKVVLYIFFFFFHKGDLRKESCAEKKYHGMVQDLCITLETMAADDKMQTADQDSQSG